MADRYVYSYLETSCIRLLRIISLAPEIRFRFEVVSLDSHPTYNALSYLWGDDRPFKRILIEDELNGTPKFVSIAENLSICLSSLKDFIGSTIWIDALCINQQDAEEKSRQVLRMTSVYEQATQVLLWLGPAADGSDRAMDGILRYGQPALESGLLNLGREFLSKWPDVGDDPERLQTKASVMALLSKANEAEGDTSRANERFPRIAFAALTHREYFNRVWVKQEITLARNAVAICGDKYVQADEFHAAVTLYSMLVMWETTEWKAGRQSRYPGPFSMEELMAASTPWDLLTKIVANPAVGQFFAARRKHLFNSEKRQSLHELLHTSYIRSGAIGLQCKDPRDKIFGLLGIVEDAANIGVVADYSKSAEEVYMLVTRGLVTKQGHIDMLKWCRSRRLDPPTWVPDFNANIAYTWTDEVGTPLFKATGLTAQPRRHSDAESRSILLHGVILDTVTSVGSRFSHDADKTFDQMAARKMFEEIESYLEGNSIYRKEDWIDAAWRIPICDKELHPTSMYFRRATEGSKRQFVALLTKPMSDAMAETMSYQASMQYKDGARPIVSASGYVGLAPSSTEPGDVLCLIYGGSTPFVLRPAGDGTYFLVGETYVYGVMDGEGMDLNLAETVFELV
jgi:hypothetical protein